MSTVNPSEVQLWWLPVTAVAPEQIEDWTAALPAEEQASIARFTFARDRLVAGLTRVLVRRVLGEVARVPPHVWCFSRTLYGRPMIANHGFSWLEFNVSHTRSLVVCAVSRGGTLGVDVEALSRVRAVVGLERYFSPSEAADVRALPPGRRLRRFYEYWTLKEAYLKAKGTGLLAPLDAFSFRIDDRGIRISLSDQRSGDENTPWNFFLGSPDSEHVLAAAHAPPTGSTATFSLLSAARVLNVDPF